MSVKAVIQSTYTGTGKLMAPKFVLDCPRARLLMELPTDRYRILSPEGRVPRIGDLLVLGHGFTIPKGLPMVVAYFPTLSAFLYEAEIYESELKTDLMPC